MTLRIPSDTQKGRFDGYENSVRLHTELTQKEHVEFEGNFHIMTMLCHLKENIEEYMIHPYVLSHNFHSSLMLFLFQNTMLACAFLSILQNVSGEYSAFEDSFAVMLVKFPCSVALHLVLYPEVLVGMEMMKFANN